MSGAVTLPPSSFWTYCPQTIGCQDLWGHPQDTVSADGGCLRRLTPPHCKGKKATLSLAPTDLALLAWNPGVLRPSAGQLISLPLALFTL